MTEGPCEANKQQRTITDIPQRITRRIEDGYQVFLE
jgi:hypothetical protein